MDIRPVSAGTRDARERFRVSTRYTPPLFEEPELHMFTVRTPEETVTTETREEAVIEARAMSARTRSNVVVSDEAGCVRMVYERGSLSEYVATTRRGGGGGRR